VLLRNPYADIGLTCLDGQAAVWIGERIDRDYRIRCEWSDVSGPARRWLTSIAPTFEASAARLGFAPIHQPVDQPWLKAPDRALSGDHHVPIAHLWRMARRQPLPHHR
jgi:hypothetical protein